MTSSMPEGSASERLSATLASLWDRRRPEVLDSVASCIEIARRLGAERATDPQIDWLTVRSAIHQLIGVLGVYGIVEARSLVVRVDELARNGTTPEHARGVTAMLIEIEEIVRRHPGASAGPEDQ